MTSTHDVRIERTGTQPARILIDGTDLARLATSVRVDLESTAFSIITLELVAPSRLGIVADEALIELGDETRTLLTNLGWTPPGDQ